MKLTPARLGVAIWALIYGGLVATALGLALRNVGSASGDGLALAGLIGVAAGAVLVWIRARNVQAAAVPAADPSPPSSESPR